MNDPVPRNLISEISDMITQRIGITYPHTRWEDLMRRILTVVRELEFSNVESFHRWFTSVTLTRNEIEILSGYFTVGETYFFRDQRGFELLEGVILPALIHARLGKQQQLKIWSAGCSTGEEPYSLAILLSRMINLADWDVTILGTDINPMSLEKASQGVYTSWSFRGGSPEIQQQYFRETLAGHFEIIPRIKDMVTFSTLNLMDNLYPSMMNNTWDVDVILCRNVLMYFSPACAKKVAHKFFQTLVNGGCLLVSPVEVSKDVFQGFAERHSPKGTLYQKVHTQSAHQGGDTIFDGLNYQI
ncbi:MAG: protein-glutamate O-methyltransferase CheR [Candidatus Latescibacteria bacterium]|nr:protein-glutamate O-methyltransferase CheR [Candidatus Latescibacterota bacterium]